MLASSTFGATLAAIQVVLKMFCPRAGPAPDHASVPGRGDVSAGDARAGIEGQ
jgi:hypothetical protein